MHIGIQILTGHRESNEHSDLFFKQTDIGLNNISINFLIIGKHKDALETLSDAIEMIKNYIRGM